MILGFDNLSTGIYLTNRLPLSVHPQIWCTTAYWAYYFAYICSVSSHVFFQWRLCCNVLAATRCPVLFCK